MKQRSRLLRQKTYQTKKSLVLSIVGITFVIFAISKFGYPLLVSFTGILVGVNAKNDTTSLPKDSKEFIPPPVFDSLPSATNSAKIIVSGSAVAKQEVQLFVNGKSLDNQPTKDNDTFRFTDVMLTKGDNTLKAKTIIDGTKESEFSDTSTITYNDAKPKLELSTPKDGDTFSKDNQTVTVTGTTDPGDKITINDFWAIVDDKGNYSYTLNLVSGDNKIHVTATDIAGNTNSQDIKVTYNQ